MSKEFVKDWTGKVIGSIDTQPNGDKIVRDFYGRVKGTYVKRLNITKDFYGHQVGKGDQSMGLLYM